jgi:hypothetical protein
MTFKTQMDADLQSVFLNTDEFASTLTTSAGATLKGVADYGQVLGDYDLGGQFALASVVIAKADLPAPTRYNTLTIDGVAWRIENYDQGDGHSWIITISRDRRIS